jgi:hypothetical protein
MAIGYFQPVTRMGVADLLGKPISRDVIGALRSFDLIATGPRSPQPGAPYTYVTTPAFLSLAGLASLRDLADLDRLEEAGLLGKAPLPEELRDALGIRDEAAGEQVATAKPRNASSARPCPRTEQNPEQNPLDVGCWHVYCLRCGAACGVWESP